MPEDINLQLPPALEAFGVDFARVVQLASDQPGRHPNRLRRDGPGVRRWLGRGRRPAWRRLGVLVFLAASATAAAATIPLFGGSQRLTGAVPKPALTSPGPAVAGVPVRLPAGLRYAIPVTPDLEAGDTGWCSSDQFTLPAARTHLIDGGGACAPASAHAVTIVAGGGALTNVLSSLPGLRQHQASGGRPSSANRPAFLTQWRARIQSAMRQTVWINSFVVNDQVARIRVGNVSFVPRPDPELAPDWRAVVFFTRGLLAKFELIDRHGRAIDQTGAQESVPTVPVTTVNPRHLPAAVCSLGASDLPRLGSQWEVVADRTPTRGRNAPPDALFSCARAWYAFPSAHAVYSAAILLDAQNPARTAPNLPGLTPSTHPGDYEEASSAGGQITAKRVGNAWLLVQGPDQRQRTALLNNINVAGTAIHR
jgi:hypothetical protein